MTEEELSPEEREEAEALAHALERGVARASLPEDALEAAALLRFSQDGGALPEDRMKAILDQVLAEARPMQAAEPASPMRWLRWLLPVAGVGVAAAAAVALMVTAVEPPPPAAALPAPDARLLRAQAEVASGGDGEALATLDHEMSQYRGAMLAALTEHYER